MTSGVRLLRGQTPRVHWVFRTRNKPTPLANLHHALLEKAGIDLEAFGDSTGPLKELFEPLGI